MSVAAPFGMTGMPRTDMNGGPRHPVPVKAPCIADRDTPGFATRPGDP